MILGVHVVRDSTHDQASLQLHEFRNKLTVAGAAAMFNFMSVHFSHKVSCFAVCTPYRNSFVSQATLNSSVLDWQSFVCQEILNSSDLVFPCPL